MRGRGRAGGIVWAVVVVGVAVLGGGPRISLLSSVGDDRDPRLPDPIECAPIGAFGPVVETCLPADSDGYTSLTEDWPSAEVDPVPEEWPSAEVDPEPEDWPFAQVDPVPEEWPSAEVDPEPEERGRVMDTADADEEGGVEEASPPSSGPVELDLSGVDDLPEEVKEQIKQAVERAENDKVRFPEHDGKEFQNRDGDLPEGRYREWTAAGSGEQRGDHRVIIGGDPESPDSIYYWDHDDRYVQLYP